MTISGIKGPYWDKANGVHRVMWLEDGKRRTKSSTDVAAINEFRGSLSSAPGNIDEPEKQALKLKLKKLGKSFTGSASEIKAAIADAIRAANQAAIDGELLGLKALSAYISTLKDASTAIVPHSAYVELEEEHAKLVAWAEGVIAGRITPEEGATQPSILRAPVATLKGRAGPGTKAN